jgi:CubicO group peptidase (beta-lactamase class C family)
VKSKAVNALFLLLPLAMASAQRIDITAARLSAVDRYLSDISSRQPIPGFVVAVVSGDRLVFARGYGVRTLGTRDPVTERDLFAVGSLTKSFTAMAVMQQVERGKVSLDDHVIRYLPWFRTADKGRSDLVTIRMLLSNTSGIPSVDAAIASRDTSDDADLRLVRGLSSRVLASDPGRSFEYSNEGFTVAGLVLEQITGLPYREYLRRFVLEPLGMDSSTTDPAVITRVKTAAPHTVGIGAGIVSPAAALSSSYIAAGSLLHCSAEDLSHYLIALLNGGAYRGTRVLSESSVRALWTPAASFVGRSVEEGGDGSPGRYGLGWMMGNVEGRWMIQHGGNTGAMTSWTAMLPDSGLGVTILTNIDSLDPYRYPSLMTVGNNIFHIIAGEPATAWMVPTIPDPTSNAYELPARLYSRYVGRYSSFDSTASYSMDISIGDCGLTAKICRGPDYVIRASLDFVNESLAELRGIGPALPVRFAIRPDGNVLGVAFPVFGVAMNREREGEPLPRAAGIPGHFSFPLPPPWRISAEGDLAFAYGAPTARTVRAELPGSGGTLTVFELPDPGAESGEEPDWAAWEKRLGIAPTSRGIAASETVSGVTWFERAYECGGSNGGQKMIFLTGLGGKTYGALLSVPVGGLSAQSAVLRRVFSGFTIGGR